MAGVSSLTRSLLDLVFPPRCVNCHTLGALLCERCRATIAIPQPPLCARCGRPLLVSHVDQPCALCASGRGPANMTSLRVATVYDGVMRAAILAYKFHGARRLSADLVTHVPLHATRRRQRGYDQAQLLACAMARRLGLPFLPSGVRRVRATEAQTHLQGDERITNVAQAFELANSAVIERIKDRRILLIDDVIATDSTLDATAAALVEAQPAAIYGFALSRPDDATKS
jgi:ComF family protein